MNQQMVLRIKNSHNRINSIKELHTTFLRHIKEHAAIEGLPGEVTIQEQSITVNCFGIAIIAEPKTVKANDDLFSIEYIFFVGEKDEEEELWRFYLTPDGHVQQTLEQDSAICDFDNPSVAKHICVPVMSAALDSILFKPMVRNR